MDSMEKFNYLFCDTCCYECYHTLTNQIKRILYENGIINLTTISHELCANNELAQIME